MKNVTLLLLLLSVFIARLPSAAIAEPEEGKDKDAASAEEARFDLNFPGGTFRDLSDQIQEVTGKRPNVIVGPGARDLEIPEFMLGSVTVDEVYNALQRLLGTPLAAKGEERLVWDAHQTGGGPHIWTFDVVVSRPSPPPPPQPPRAPSRASAPAPVTHVFQIGPFLNHFRLEDLTTAIEMAWEMASEEGVNLRYHEETGLLFVHGSSQQLQLVELVLGRLETPPPSPEDRMEALGREIERRQQMRKEIIRQSESR